MTTPNLDALAKLAPFYAMQGKVWSRADGLSLAASDILAARNAIAELLRVTGGQP